LKIKVRCRKCGFEMTIEISTSPLGALRPGCKAKGIKIKWGKDELDKILDQIGKTAGRSDLEQLGIHIPIPEWNEAEERARLRRFLREHLRISKERRQSRGEKFQISTAPWQMGDTFKDVDLASSEAKSMGVEDLRMIPGVTLQKRVYDHTKGHDREILRGIKFINIIDVSGSMFGVGYSSQKGAGQVDKIHKALMMAEYTYKLCKKLGYNYYLALFSDHAARIPQKEIKEFFRDEDSRAKYGAWRGGTVLSSALKAYKIHELKDANLVIMSDMDLGDLEDTKKQLTKIGELTNSFKIVLIEYSSSINEERIKRTKELFPNGEVQIEVMRV